MSIITKELLTPVVEIKEELEALVAKAYEQYEHPTTNPLILTRYHKVQMSSFTQFLQEVQRLTKDNYIVLDDHYANRINGVLLNATFIKPQTTIKSEKAKIRHQVVSDYQANIKEQERQRLIQLKQMLADKEATEAQQKQQEEEQRQLLEEALEQLK